MWANNNLRFLHYFSGRGTTQCTKLVQYYKSALQSWSKFTKTSLGILKKYIERSSYYFESQIFDIRENYFFPIHIKTVVNKLDDNTKESKKCHEINQHLIYKRYCISEYSRIESSLTQTLIPILIHNNVQHTFKRHNIKISKNVEFLNSDNYFIKVKIFFIEIFFIPL